MGEQQGEERMKATEIRGEESPNNKHCKHKEATRGKHYSILECLYECEIVWSLNE